MDEPVIVDFAGIPPSSPVQEEEFDFSSQTSSSSNDEHDMDAASDWPMLWHSGSGDLDPLPLQSNEDTQPSLNYSKPDNVRSLLYDLLASPHGPHESSYSKMQTEMDTLAGKRSGPFAVRGKGLFQPTVANNDYTTFAGLKSHHLGKGKGKAADFLENHSIDSLACYDEEINMDTFEDYSYHEEFDDNFTPLFDFGYDDRETVGDYSPDEQSLDLRANLFNFWHHSIGKPSFQNENFVAGPSRITLDDLRRNSVMNSRHWQ